MTPAEIVTAAIALISLAVSILTAYKTLIANFKGVILPRHRIILAQIDNLPCLVLECEFINDGAKPGVIEDILVKIHHHATGTQAVFVPFFIREQYNIYQNYRSQDFTPFSGVSLGARQKRELFVAFKPIQENYDLDEGTATLRVSLCSNIVKKNWKESPFRISVDFDQRIVKNWKSATGSPLQVLAREISQSRSEYLRKP